MAKPFILEMFLFSGLRRMSYRTPMRAEAMTAARLRRGWYRCAHCKGEFKRKAIAVDHIAAVVNPETGFRTWDEYIERLFCPASALQILCNFGKESCHKVKSKAENKIRREAKKHGN